MKVALVVVLVALVSATLATKADKDISTLMRMIMRALEDEPDIDDGSNVAISRRGVGVTQYILVHCETVRIALFSSLKGLFPKESCVDYPTGSFANCNFRLKYSYTDSDDDTVYISKNESFVEGGFQKSFPLHTDVKVEVCLYTKDGKSIEQCAYGGETMECCDTVFCLTGYDTGLCRHDEHDKKEIQTTKSTTGCESESLLELEKDLAKLDHTISEGKVLTNDMKDEVDNLLKNSKTN